MTANLTEEEFSKHQGTKFHTRLDARETDLDLKEHLQRQYGLTGPLIR